MLFEVDEQSDECHGRDTGEQWDLPQDAAACLQAGERPNGVGNWLVESSNSPCSSETARVGRIKELTVKPSVVCTSCYDPFRKCFLVMFLDSQDNFED